MCGSAISAKMVLNDLHAILNSLLSNIYFTHALYEGFKNRNNSCKSFQDINDGRVIQKQRENWKLLRGYTHLSISIFIDSCNVFVSSKFKEIPSM